MFRDLWFDEYFSAYVGQIEILKMKTEKWKPDGKLGLY